MKILIVLASVMLVASCSVVKSTYGGNATQNQQGMSNTYPMILELEIRGNKIKGTSFFMIPNDPSTFVYYAFKGTKNGDELSIQEYKILKGTEIAGTWLKKNMKLKITNDENGEVLLGTWVAQDNASIQGEFYATYVKMTDQE